MQNIANKIKKIKKERNKEKLSNIAYDSIKSAIVNFEFEPGSYLSENLLADVLGMSRTPVREALKLLAQEKLINMNDGGITVSDISIEDLNEIFIARKALEKEAIKFSFNNFSYEETTSSRESWREFLIKIKDGDKISWKQIAEKDKELHSSIIYKSNNTYIISLYNNISSQIERYQLLSAVANNNIVDTINQHIEIIDLIEKKKEDLLVKKISNHITDSISNISKGMLNDNIDMI